MKEVCRLPLINQVILISLGSIDREVSPDTLRVIVSPLMKTLSAPSLDKMVIVLVESGMISSAQDYSK